MSLDTVCQDRIYLRGNPPRQGLTFWNLKPILKILHQIIHEVYDVCFEILLTFEALRVLKTNYMLNFNNFLTTSPTLILKVSLDRNFVSGGNLLEKGSRTP